MNRTTITRRSAIAHIATAVALSGCAKTRRDDVLRVAYSPPTLSKLYQSIADEFMRRHPGITVELLPANEYKGVMQRDFRLALVDDESDVSHVALNHLRFYVDRDLATPLDDFIANEPLQLTTHSSIGRFKGQVRALPFAVSVPTSYFNADLCRRAGFDPATVAQLDWPGILELAQAIGKIGGNISGMFFDYTPESALAWQMLVYGRGGRMMSPDERTIAFGDDAGLWSAQLLQAIGRTGQVDMSRENARMAFMAGLLGCYQNTSANIARFSQTLSGFEMAIAPLPVLPNIGRLPAAGNAVVLTTRKKARHDLAWKYIRFVAGPVGQTLMARSTGYLSLNRSAVEDETLLKPLVDKDPVYRSLYQTAAILDEWYAFPGQRSLHIAEMITERTRRILLGREQPRQALSGMVKEAQRLINWR